MNPTLKKIKRLTERSISQVTPFVKETRPDLPKVIVNSFPKSGTHLLSKLVASLGFIELPLLVMPQGYCDFSKAGPWSEWEPIVKGGVSNYGNPTYVSCPITRVLPRFRSGQFAPTHFGRKPSTERMLEAKKFKHLLIVRDLRDCVVSYVHHHLSLTGSFHRADWYYYLSALNDMEEQLLAVISGRHMFLESYRTQIEKTSLWFDHPDVLVVCYEHLIGPGGGGSPEIQLKEVGKILEFLDMDSGKGRVEEAARTLWGGGSRTFRAGKTGNWKDVFTPRVQEAFDRELGDIQAKVENFIQKYRDV